MSKKKKKKKKSDKLTNLEKSVLVATLVHMIISIILALKDLVS